MVPEFVFSHSITDGNLRLLQSSGLCWKWTSQGNSSGCMYIQQYVSLGLPWPYQAMRTYVILFIETCKPQVPFKFYAPSEDR